MPRSYSYVAELEAKGEIDAETAADAALIVRQSTPQGLGFKGVTLATDSENSQTIAFDATGRRPLSLRSATIVPDETGEGHIVTFYDNRRPVASMRIIAAPLTATVGLPQLVDFWQKGRLVF
jgi:hypothetical protein